MNEIASEWVAKAEGDFPDRQDREVVTTTGD